MNSNSTGVLFDLDGTLIDTAPDMTKVLLEMIKEFHGDKKITNKVARNYVSDGSIGLLEIGFPSASTTRITDLQKTYLNLYQKNLCKQTKFFLSLRNLISDLDKKQIKWGIVTNKPTRMTLPLLISLKTFTQYVISGDTLTSRKPNPLPLTLACKMMNIESVNAIYVGDAERDIIAGISAGMKTIVAGYGYIKHDDNPSKWGAGMIAETPSQLNEMIKNELNI
jgi:phosphoglycolate phosphatase